MSEAVIVNEILLAIGKAFPGSVRAWRNNTGAFKDPTGRLVRYGLPGSPDIIGIIRGGRFLGIEVKTAKGKASDLQRSFSTMATGLGAVVFLARSVDEAMGKLTAELVPPLPGVE
jgi:hypothetical protein